MIIGGFFIDAAAPVQGRGAFLYQYLLLITDPITGEFLLGIFAAMWYQRMSPRKNRWSQCLMVAGVAIIIYSYYSPFPWLPFALSAHTKFFTIPVFIFFIVGLKYQRTGGARFPEWLMFTGKISYSIYLLHMAVMFLTIYLFRFFGGKDYFDIFSHRFDLLIVTLLVTYVLSFFSWRVIETQFSGYIRDRLLACLDKRMGETK